MAVSIFDRMASGGHEQLIFCHDRSSGLKALIAIHDTTLGPALGGCRMYPYATEAEAVEDALRLARGMTYKAAAVGVNHGGGKAVIWGDPRTDKREDRFRALGRYVQALKGRFITGTDMGTNKEDFIWAHAETAYLVALPEEYGGSGDSSLITAFGVFRGMLAAALEVWGEATLKGRHVAVQGVGKVGYHLVRHLVDEGAQVTVADVYPENVERVRRDFPGVATVAPDAIYGVPCDIFAPCAIGGILNDATIRQLRCRVVAGSANNQLAEPRHGDELHRRGILYCPDYIINAGGLIQVADEVQGFHRDRAFRKAAAIFDLLREIFRLSREQGIPTHRAADLLAEQRIAALAAVQRIHVPE